MTTRNEGKPKGTELNKKGGLKMRYDKITTMLRNDTARHIREIHRIMSPLHYQPDTNPVNWPAIWFIMACLALGAFVLAFEGCSYAYTLNKYDYTDNQYVNAIYKAEGGISAKFAYGIRSVHYRNITEAGRICYKTVKNNRRRFKEYGYRHYPRFIQFLASRYCPTTGAHLTRSEARLNKYWIKNVTFYLEHPTKG